MSKDKTEFTSWFRSAAPYIRAHRGKTFVVLTSPRAFHGDGCAGLVHDLALLTSLGIKLALVLDARHAIEAALGEQGLDAECRNGVTTAAAMECVKAVVGKLLMDAQAKFSMGVGDTPMSNAEIRVNVGNYVSAKPLGVIDGVDCEFSGQTRRVAAHAIVNKLDAGEIVALPPLGYSITGEAYSLCAVALAFEVAVALQADKLIYLMEKDSLLGLTGPERVNQWPQTEAQARLAQTDQSSAGYPFLKHAVAACAQGVERAHLLNQEEDGVILSELFTRDGSGLMLTVSAYDALRKAAVADIGGILNLIEPLERQGVLVKRSREKLELEADHFTLLARDGAIIGCAGLYPYPEDKVAEIAGLVVHPDYRNSGRGNQLLDEVEKEAARLGLNRVFVLTTQASHWFIERGFAEVSLETLPVARQTLYNYQRNAKVLLKDLS